MLANGLVCRRDRINAPPGLGRSRLLPGLTAARARSEVMRVCLRTETRLGPSALHLLGAVRSCGPTSPPVGHKARRPQEFGTESILQLEPERLGVWGRSQASGNWRPLGLEEPSRTLALYHGGSQARHRWLLPRPDAH